MRALRLYQGLPDQNSLRGHRYDPHTQKLVGPEPASNLDRQEVLCQLELGAKIGCPEAGLQAEYVRYTKS